MCSCGTSGCSLGFPWSLISTSLYALPSESYQRRVFIFPSASRISTEVLGSPYGPGFLLAELCFEDGVTSISFPDVDVIVLLPPSTVTLYPYNYSGQLHTPLKKTHFSKPIFTSA